LQRPNRICFSLLAVGHNVVHDGREFIDPAEVTDAVIAALAALTPLEPLHQPRCLSPMRTVRSLRPDLTQTACFDTAFHHGLAPPASRFAVPRRFEEIGIRRSGFHGLRRPRGGRRLPQKTAAGRLF
jgi:acetate kinase